MRADKLFPRRGSLALWRWRQAMALEDIPYGLVTNCIAEVRQGTDDPVVAPGAILPCHTYHQGFQLLLDLGPSQGFPVLGAVKLLRHELTVPGKNRLGLDDGGHFLKGLLPQLLTNLGQCLAFAIGQPHPACDLVA
jgi:hypothetical protein